MAKVSKKYTSDYLHAFFLPISVSSLDLSRLQEKMKNRPVGFYPRAVFFLLLIADIISGRR